MFFFSGSKGEVSGSDTIGAAAESIFSGQFFSGEFRSAESWEGVANGGFADCFGEGALNGFSSTRAKNIPPDKTAAAKKQKHIMTGFFFLSR